MNRLGIVGGILLACVVLCTSVEAALCSSCQQCQSAIDQNHDEIAQLSSEIQAYEDYIDDQEEIQHQAQLDLAALLAVPPAERDAAWYAAKNAALNTISQCNSNISTAEGYILTCAAVIGLLDAEIQICEIEMAQCEICNTH
jgi:hypothetical protein